MILWNPESLQIGLNRGIHCLYIAWHWFGIDHVFFDSLISLILSCSKLSIQGFYMELVDSQIQTNSLKSLINTYLININLPTKFKFSNSQFGISRQTFILINVSYYQVEALPGVTHILRTFSTFDEMQKVYFMSLLYVL